MHFRPLFKYFSKGDCVVVQVIRVFVVFCKGGQCFLSTFIISNKSIYWIRLLFFFIKCPSCCLPCNPRFPFLKRFSISSHPFLEFLSVFNDPSNDLNRLFNDVLVGKVHWCICRIERLKNNSIILFQQLLHTSTVTIHLCNHNIT